MRAYAVLALTLCSFAASPALAKDKLPPDPNKRICRQQEAETGSIMGGKRECHTRAEWGEIDKQNEANTRRFSDAQRSSGSMRPN